MYGLDLDGKQINDNLKYYALKEKKTVKATSTINNGKSIIDIPCANDDLVAVYVEPSAHFYVQYRKDNKFRLVVLADNATIHYYVFSSKLNKIGEYGIEYYNEQGQLIYSSNHAYLRIFGKIRFEWFLTTQAFPRTTELKKNANQKIGYILGTQFPITKTKYLEIPAVKIKDKEVLIDEVAYSEFVSRERTTMYLIDFFFADLTGL